MYTGGNTPPTPYAPLWKAPRTPRERAPKNDERGSIAEPGFSTGPILKCLGLEGKQPDKVGGRNGYADGVAAAHHCCLGHLAAQHALLFFEEALGPRAIAVTGARVLPQNNQQPQALPGIAKHAGHFIKLAREILVGEFVRDDGQ